MPANQNNPPRYQSDMTRRRFLYAHGGAVACLTIAAATPARAMLAVPRYRTLYIGPFLPGDPNGASLINDFNDAGECVGTATPPDPSVGGAAFYFRPNADFTGGDFVRINTLLPPGVPSQGVMDLGVGGINNSGVIAGTGYWHPDGLGQPGIFIIFRLHPPTIAGGSWTFEQGPDFAPGFGAANPRINDAGDVVFHSYTDGTATGNFEMHAMIWPSGGAAYVDVGTPIPGAKVFTTNSARAGDLVMISAYLVSNTSYDRAYRIDYNLTTQAKTFRLLGPLTRNAMSDQANDVNTSGMVVGEANAKSGSVTDRAFRWTSTTGMVALGTFGGEDSFGYSVNDFGDIVGHAEYGAVRKNPPVSAPFLYTPADGKMWDVSKLIDGPQPPYLGDQRITFQVNNNRMIAGPNIDNGTNAPGKAAFLLVPTT